jgi:hypothetical protein
MVEAGKDSLDHQYALESFPDSQAVFERLRVYANGGGERRSMSGTVRK